GGVVNLPSCSRRGARASGRGGGKSRFTNHESRTPGMSRKGLTGLSAQIKERLIQQALERRMRQVEARSVPLRTEATAGETPEQFYRFDLHPGYQQLRIMAEAAARLGVPSPYFKVHEGRAGVTTRIEGREYLNYASYNYLGLSGSPEVNQAAKDAIDRYGTSVSASRLVAGERGIHRE